MSGSLVKAFDIIRLLSNRQGELRLCDISRDLKMNKTTAFRYLDTMLNLGLVEKRKDVYYLGTTFLEYGSKVMLHDIVSFRIHPILSEVAEQINETVNLATINNDMALYLDKAECKRSLQMKSAVGDSLPLHCTALGKAILSVLSPRNLESLTGRIQLQGYTEHTITEKEELIKQINRIREKGYSIECEEFEEGLACCAVPLMIEKAGFYGGISVSGPSNRLTREIMEEIKVILMEAREKIYLEFETD